MDLAAHPHRCAPLPCGVRLPRGPRAGRRVCARARRVAHARRAPRAHYVYRQRPGRPQGRARCCAAAHCDDARARREGPRGDPPWHEPCVLCVDVPPCVFPGDGPKLHRDRALHRAAVDGRRARRRRERPHRRAALRQHARRDALRPRVRARGRGGLRRNDQRCALWAARGADPRRGRARRDARARRPPPRAPPLAAWPLLCADAPDQRHAGHEDCQRGALCAGLFDHGLRHGRRGGAHRERHAVRPRLVRLWP